jgi:hypothetical protein
MMSTDMSAFAEEDVATPLALKLRVDHAAAFDPGKKPDWVGLWFKLDALMIGDFIEMRAGTPDPETGEMNWRYLSHHEHDGYSGLAHTWASEGIKFEMPASVVHERKKPSWLTRAAAVWRMWSKELKPAAAWKTLDRRWTPPPGGCGASQAIAVRSVGAEASKAVIARSKTLGISMNSLLLAALTRASSPDLDPGPVIWCMPINMRGAVKLERESDNHVSFIDFEIPRDASAASVHRQVKQAFRRFDHWGNWLIMNIGRIVGFQGMRRIYEYNLEQTEGRSGVGTMSNLGTWKGIGDWYVAPGAAYGAIGCGVIVCDGKVNLTLEAHPSIATDVAWSRAFLARWIAEIEAETEVDGDHAVRAA